MSATVRLQYGVEHKCGDRLVIDGKRCTLVGFPGLYLGIRFDGKAPAERIRPGVWSVPPDQPGKP